MGDKVLKGVGDETLEDIAGGLDKDEEQVSMSMFEAEASGLAGSHS